MIITRAPFRVSFCGGGSDLPSFYEKYGGCVLSTTIRKYMYLTLRRLLLLLTFLSRHQQQVLRHRVQVT